MAKTDITSFLSLSRRTTLTSCAAAVHSPPLKAGACLFHTRGAVFQDQGGLLNQEFLASRGYVLSGMVQDLDEGVQKCLQQETALVRPAIQMPDKRLPCIGPTVGSDFEGLRAVRTAASSPRSN